MKDELDEWAIARALGRVAKFLPEDSKGKALALARRTSDPSARVRALSGLINVLPIDQKEATIQEALSAARSLSNPWLRVRALASLSIRLPLEPKEQLVREAFEVTLSISNDWVRGRALNLIYGYLPETLLDRAVAEAAKLQNQELRAVALSSMFDRLSDRLVGEVLRDIPAISDESLRAAALNDLAGRLSPEQIDWALGIARGIGDISARVNALSALATRLPPTSGMEVAREAFESAHLADHAAQRAEMLTLVTARLLKEIPTDLAAEIADDIRRTLELEFRVELFRQLLELLPADRRSNVWPEALSAAGSIENAANRAEALSSLIGYAAIDQREAVVHEILSALRL